MALLLALVLASGTQAQWAEKTSAIRDQLPSTLPDELSLVEHEPQKYHLITTWYNRDARGDATAKFVISADYTRGLPGDSVYWTNMQIEVFADPAAATSDTINVESLEGLSYRSPHDIARPGLFSRFPADESRHLLQTLIWDAIGLETFAWTYFDRLELNKTLKAAEFEGFDVQLGQWGSLKMKNLRLTWTGISRLNGELCAVINYESFVNPAFSGPETTPTAGRSLYWGVIYVSLEDKQIEYGTMNEDVVLRLPASGEARILNIQRAAMLEKIP
jgi:hypothetical protein